MALSRKVVTFTKSTGAATATQTIDSGFGVQAKAMILLTFGTVSDATQESVALHALGLSTPSTARSYCAASGAVSLTSKTYKRAAAKAMTIVDREGTLLAECDATFQSDGTIDLAWTTNNSSAYRMGALILGGSALSASVVDWTERTSTGSKAVTGAGFQPQGLLTIGSDLDGALPAQGTFAVYTVAATDGTTSWAMSGMGFDNNFGTTESHRWARPNLEAGIDAGSKGIAGALTSLDSDGFTLNITAVSGFETSHAIRRATLCLRGANVQAGSFAKTTASAPTSQSVSLSNILPRAVIFASQNFQSADDTVHVDDLGVLGFSDGVTAFGGGWAYTSGSSTSDNGAKRSDNGAAMSAVTESTSLVARCGVPTFANNSMSLTWDTNSADSGDILYLALGDPPTASTATPRIPWPLLTSGDAL